MKKIINELVNFNLTMAIASFFGTFIFLIIDAMVGIIFFSKIGFHITLFFIVASMIIVIIKKFIK